MDSLGILGRSQELFKTDIDLVSKRLNSEVRSNRFLVIGGAGSIGQAVSREIFERNPEVLHVVDISENNLVELVRDLRSSKGYIDGDFQTFALDCGSPEYRALMQKNKYDYVLNLSALKHVRSESDPFTLMRLIQTNIFNTLNTHQLAVACGAKKYFCVSTDKAANPVNLMGASKRIMELFMARESSLLPTSMARFANVAFSDGSLLHGFNQRLLKGQPISAPRDVRRYFVTPKESGQLCLIAAIFGENLDVFFPKLGPELRLTRFSDIARRYLNQRGYKVHECLSEAEAREGLREQQEQGYWPCYFFDSDTTGEKDFEEFYTSEEELDMARFRSIGIIKSSLEYDGKALNDFEFEIADLLETGHWTKDNLVTLVNSVLPNFDHLETGKYLDQRM